MDAVRRWWNRIALGACITLAAGASLAPTSARAEEGDELLEQAEAAFDRGDRDAAVAALRAAFEGGAPAVRAEAGRRLVDEAEDRDASDEERAVLHAALGGLLLEQSAWFEATTHLEAAALLRGTELDRFLWARALVGVARENVQSGSATAVGVLPYLEDARAALDGIGGSDAQRVRAEALYWGGDLDGALAAWRTADMNGDDAETRRHLELFGHAAYARGSHEEAARSFERAGARRAAAAAWTAARKPDEAMAHYADLLGASPDDPTLIADAVSAARYMDARARVEPILASLAPRSNEARAMRLRALATLAEDAGAYDRAADLLQEAAAAAPEDVEALFALARVRLRAGGERATEAAVAAWAEALARDPRDERARLLLWEQAGLDVAEGMRRGRLEPAIERAITAQRALVTHVPDDALAWANMGNTLRVAGRLEEALAAYDRALAVDDGDPAIVSDRGLVLSALERHEDALRDWERAVDMDPTFTAAHQNAARMRFLAGEDDAAAAHLAAAAAGAYETGEPTARLYRFLLDRTWRARRRPELR
jgi:tetratricopeptide (TPR) repeat protein